MISWKRKKYIFDWLTERDFEAFEGRFGANSSVFGSDIDETFGLNCSEGKLDSLLCSDNKLDSLLVIELVRAVTNSSDVEPIDDELLASDDELDIGMVEGMITSWPMRTFFGLEAGCGTGLATRVRRRLSIGVVLVGESWMFILWKLSIDSYF